MTELGGINKLEGRVLDHRVEELQGQLIEELVERLDAQALKDNVEVYLTQAGKAYRVESVVRNGPCIQINIDESSEPTIVMLRSAESNDDSSA